MSSRGDGLSGTDANLQFLLYISGVLVLPSLSHTYPPRVFYGRYHYLISVIDEANEMQLIGLLPFPLGRKG